MICHECARQSIQAPAVGQCRFCLVGLCKEHLVEAYRSRVIPQYACDHGPERAFHDGHRSEIGHPREIERPARAALVPRRV